MLFDVCCRCLLCLPRLATASRLAQTLSAVDTSSTASPACATWRRVQVTWAALWPQVNPPLPKHLTLGASSSGRRRSLASCNVDGHESPPGRVRSRVRYHLCIGYLKLDVDSPRASPANMPQARLVQGKAHSLLICRPNTRSLTTPSGTICGTGCVTTRPLLLQPPSRTNWTTKASSTRKIWNHSSVMRSLAHAEMATRES